MHQLLKILQIFDTEEDVKYEDEIIWTGVFKKIVCKNKISV